MTMGPHVRRPRAGPAAVPGSGSRSASRNGPNASSDQACPPRRHRDPARDSRRNRRGRPFGDPPRHPPARRPRPSRPRAGSAQSCERSRPGSQRRPTPGRPRACECGPHVSATSVSPGGLGGDMGGPPGSPASPRSARRGARRVILRGHPNDEERDTCGPRGVTPRHVLAEREPRSAYPLGSATLGRWIRAHTSGGPNAR